MSKSQKQILGDNLDEYDDEDDEKEEMQTNMP